MRGRPTDREIAIFFATFGPHESEERARCDRVFAEVVVPAALEHGLEAYRADRESEPGNVTVQTFEALASASVVVCDITGTSPNVMYELGVVHAANLPVILLADDAETLPFYARGERVIRTGVGTGDDYTHARVDLIAALGKALSPTYAPNSVVSQVLGLSGPYPPALRRAINSAERPLYREGMEYELEVRDVTETQLTMRMAHRYGLVNRTHTTYAQVVGIVPMRGFQPVFGRIGGTELPLDEPDHLTERGWQVPIEVKPESVTDIEFVADIHYRMPDSNVYASYLPATSFRLELRYPPDRVRIVVESLFPERLHAQTIARGVVLYEAPRAVRAYEGLKIDWLAPTTRQ